MTVINGTAISPTGEVLASATIEIEPNPKAVVSVGGMVMIPNRVKVVTGPSGEISVELVTGNYDCVVKTSTGAVQFSIAVPEQATADWADLIDQAAIVSMPDVVAQVFAARDEAVAAAEQAEASSGGSYSIEALVQSTAEGISLTTEGQLFAVASDVNVSVYRKSGATSALVDGDMQDEFLARKAPSAPALISYTEYQKDGKVKLKSIVGKSYSSGNNAVNALQAAWDEFSAQGMTIVDPDNIVLTLNSTVFFSPGLKMDLGLRTAFLRNFSGGQSLFTNRGGVTPTTLVDDIKWRNGFISTTSPSMTGPIILLGARKAKFEGVRVEEFYAGTTFGGQAWRLYGPDITLYNCTAETNDPNTGTGPFRVLGCDNFLGFGLRAKAGDDLFQFCPASDSADHPLFNEGCTNSSFVSCRGVTRSKLAIAGLLSSTGDAVGSQALLRNLSFIDIQGSYGQHGILVSNDAGDPAILDQVSDIYVSRMRGVKNGSVTARQESVVRIEGDWDRAVGKVVFQDCAFDGPNTKVGLSQNAPGSRIFFDRCDINADERALNVTSAGTEFQGSGTWGLTAPSDLAQNVATFSGIGSVVRIGEGTTIEGVHTPSVSGVPTPRAGLFIGQGITCVTGDLEVKKSSSAGSGTVAVSAAATTTQIDHGRVSTDCEIAFSGLGTFRRAANSMSMSSSVVIAGGAISGFEGLLVTIDTEASAVTDDLETINAPVWLRPGQIVTLRTTNSGRDVTIKSGVGNIITASGGDVSLSTTSSRVSLVWDGISFRQIAAGSVASSLPRGVLQITDSTNKSLPVTAMAENVVLSATLTRSPTWTVTTSLATLNDTVTFQNAQTSAFEVSIIVGSTTIKLSRRGESATIVFDGSAWVVVERSLVADNSNSGFVPPLPNNSALFLNGVGAWANPPSGGGGVSDGDKGDIVVSSGGAVWSIDYASVNATIAPTWDNVTGKPTTLGGYGITDAATVGALASGLAGKSDIGHVHAFADLTGKPTTLGGYGITDGIAAATVAAGYQPLSAGLASLAGLSSVGLYYLSAAGTWSPVTIGANVSFSGGVLSASGGGTDEIAFLMPEVGDLVYTTVTASNGAMPNTNGVADQIRLYPYKARATMDISELLVRCAGVTTSGLAKIVVYSSDANECPDALLFESADLDFSTTGGKAAPYTTTILKGVTYWLGIRMNSTASFWGCGNGSTPNINGGNTTTNTPRVSVVRTVAFATPAPASWGWNSGEITNSNPPHIWLRRA